MDYHMNQSHVWINNHQPPPPPPIQHDDDVYSTSHLPFSSNQNQNQNPPPLYDHQYHHHSIIQNQPQQQQTTFAGSQVDDDNDGDEEEVEEGERETVEEEDDEEEEEELGAMKEMMYRMAAMQPVEIDPASVRKPGRRNVRISEDPQSVAARHRRQRISEKIRILQWLVPGGTKMDTASMLDEAVRYLKFLKRQIRLLQKTTTVLVPHTHISSTPTTTTTAADTPTPRGGFSSFEGIGHPHQLGYSNYSNTNHQR